MIKCRDFSAIDAREASRRLLTVAAQSSNENESGAVFAGWQPPPELL